MGIEEVKKEVLDNARTQAKQILKEASAERDAILKSGETTVNAAKDRLAREGEKSVEQYRILSDAETNSLIKRQRLVVEKNIINDVFLCALQDMADLPAKKREQHIAKIIKSAEKTFSIAKAYCSKKDLSLVKKFNPEADNSIAGGVILENKEGDVRLNITYESLAEKIKQENLSDVAKVLFA